MSKNRVHFQPRIELVSQHNVDKEYLRVTAPNEIREKIWDYLGLLDDLHIFHKDGKGWTQIALKTLPGHDHHVSYVLLTNVTYIATVQIIHKAAIETFLSDITHHLKQLGEEVNLEIKCGGITKDEMAWGFNLLIKNLIKKDIDTWKFNIKHHYVQNRKKQVQDLIDKGKLARNRLIFTDRKAVGLSIKELKERLRTCDDNLAILEQLFVNADRIDHCIVLLKTESEKLIDDFLLNNFNDKEFTKDIYEEWKEVEGKLTTFKKEVLSLQNEFNRTLIDDAQFAIKTVTPSA